MTAEKCLKNYLEVNDIEGYEVDSAGIKTKPQEVLETTSNRLKYHGVAVKNHIYKNLTQELVNSNDIIIAMDLNHQEFIKDKFNLNVPLFNEILKNEHKGVSDFDEKKFVAKDPVHLKEHADLTVDYIFESTPKLFEKIKLL